MKKKVAFVCVHNSCRSQMAEVWGLEDPSGGSIEGFRQTRDIIKDKVLDLIEKIKNNTI